MRGRFEPEMHGRFEPKRAVDLGEIRTVDFLITKGIKPITPLCTGDCFGIANALKDLSQGANKPACIIDYRLVEGEEEAHALDQPLKDLATNIEETVKGINEGFNLILVTGGGGQRVYPHLDLRRYLKTRGTMHLAQEPQMSNVRGYLKVGERLRRKAPAA